MRLSRIGTVGVDGDTRAWLADRLTSVVEVAGDLELRAHDDGEGLLLEPIPTLVVTPLDGAASLLRLLQERGELVPVLVLVPRRRTEMALSLLERGAVELLPVPRPTRFDLQRALASLDVQLERERRTRTLHQRLRRAEEDRERRQPPDRESAGPLRPIAASEPTAPEREYGLRRIEESLEMSRRHGVPLACLLVGLEDPERRSFDDAHLARIAGQMKRAVRSTDLLALYGEDRFLIVSPFTDRRAAEALARRLRQEVLQAGGTAVEVLVGIACFAGDLENADDLTARAARALARAATSESKIETL